MSTNDSHTQSFYQNGTDHSASTAAGQWQAKNNPGYTPPQQHNESYDAYCTRVAAQKASTT